MRDSAESRSGSNEKSCYWRRRCRSIRVALVGSDWGDSVKDYQVFCPGLESEFSGVLRKILLRRQPYHGQPCHHCSSLLWRVNRLANLMSSFMKDIIILSNHRPSPQLDSFFVFRPKSRFLYSVRVGEYDKSQVKRTFSSRKKRKNVWILSKRGGATQFPPAKNER